jgi:hypothetical protein
MAVSENNQTRIFHLFFLYLKDFVFGDFSEQEAEKLFDHDKQGVKVNINIIIHSYKIFFVFLVSMEYR